VGKGRKQKFSSIATWKRILCSYETCNTQNNWANLDKHVQDNQIFVRKRFNYLKLNRNLLCLTRNRSERRNHYICSFVCLWWTCHSGLLDIHHRQQTSMYRLSLYIGTHTPLDPAQLITELIVVSRHDRDSHHRLWRYHERSHHVCTWICPSHQPFLTWEPFHIVTVRIGLDSLGRCSDIDCRQQLGTQGCTAFVRIPVYSPHRYMRVIILSLNEMLAYGVEVEQNRTKGHKSSKSGINKKTYIYVLFMYTRYTETNVKPYQRLSSIMKSIEFDE
jgi:hypothetical protein